MIILCGGSIYKPLEMTFKSCSNQRIFPAEWKKANVVPLLDNNLISSNQSGFKLRDYCINQLITRTHNIFKD